METSVFWALFGALVTATAAGIAIRWQLRAARKERLEAIYERLTSELNGVVREMGNCADPTNLSVHKKRTVSRMLHLHLDNLVESVAIEGRSRWRKLLYRLRVERRKYSKVGAEWYLERHRYKRFSNW